LNYIVVDLGILSHNSNFYKWNLIYDDNFNPSLINKGVFFVYYITSQCLFLIFSLISIVGLIQYSFIINFTFNQNKSLLENKLPNPPYLGLDNFHVIASDFLKLIIIVLINSVTYLINMRSIMPLNLIAFWFLIFIVFFILFYIKHILDNYLTFEKNNLTKILNEKKNKDDLKYMQFSINLMNIKTKIFTVKTQLLTYLGISLSIMSILIAFFKPDWIEAIRVYVEQNVIPWF